MAIADSGVHINHNEPEITHLSASGLSGDGGECSLAAEVQLFMEFLLLLFA
jgi:hypothetical protein